MKALTWQEVALVIRTGNIPTVQLRALKVATERTSKLGILNLQVKKVNISSKSILTQASYHNCTIFIK